MKFIAKIIFSFLGNILALLAAAYFIPGFRISEDPKNILFIAFILTLLNIFIRPVVRLIFTPIIFLTLGFGIIIVNALMLYLLDYLTEGLQISGLFPLFYATLIISVVSFIFGASAKKAAKE